jgi:hypothetical protein
MSFNVGKTDQVLRVLIGFVLVLTSFAAGLSVFDDIDAVSVAAVLILTSIFYLHPAYSLLSIKTYEV